MSGIKAVVLTASIDNQDEIERWLRQVKEAAMAAEVALKEVGDVLREAPHISIQLRQSDGQEATTAGIAGERGTTAN